MLTQQDELRAVLANLETRHFGDRWWEHIDVLLDRTSAALASGSEKDLQTAIADLAKDVDSGRATSLDGGGPRKIPDRTRDKVQQLSADLDPPKAAEKGKPTGGSGR